MKRNHIFPLLLSLALVPLAVAAVPDNSRRDYREAVRLYNSGMYERARDIFDRLNDGDADVMSGAYSVLCSARLKTAGYHEMIEDFLNANPESVMAGQLRFFRAVENFDKGDFAASKQDLISISMKSLDKKQIAEHMYKRAYCDYKLGDADAALKRMTDLEKLPQSEYTVPARYIIALIHYSQKDFDRAAEYFRMTEKDGRFKSVSQYYLLECRFLNKDYDYVIENGPDMFENVPESRKAHLSRIISESYLVKGDVDRAKTYFDNASDASEVKTRADYFYAGSMLYAVSDYAGAVENYRAMKDLTDSLGQIAAYQMADSYLQLKNKVEAMQAFKTASESGYSAEIQEDALFNHAKLAFDLNRDDSVFKAYIDKYSTAKRGDDIYSYMAFSYLSDHNYAAAVQEYDKIDELSSDMRSNYMKANYLRAKELIESGSWRDAVSCLQSAAFYTDRRDPFNQLSRYWLAESYFHSGRNADGVKILVDLYNNSAMDGLPESRAIPYNLAYYYFMDEDYANAAKWFDICISLDDNLFLTDGTIRRADCDFASKQYKDAVKSYQKYIDLFASEKDLYPYYQLGLSYGLSGNIKKKIETLSIAEKSSADADYYSEALFELGRAYKENKNEAASVRCFEKLSKSSSDYSFVARSLIELGMVSRNKKQYDKALTYFKRVVGELPESEYTEDAMAAIESIYQTKGDPEGYIAYLNSLKDDGVKTDAKKEDIYFNSIEQVFLAGNYQRVISLGENYVKDYPTSWRLSDAYFYMAESYNSLGRKEDARDCYANVMNSKVVTSYSEVSTLSYARLSYEFSHFEDAYSAFEQLLSIAAIEQNRLTAHQGMMRSAYRSKAFDNAIAASERVISDALASADNMREAEHLKAKSYLESSRRAQAFAIFETLAKNPSTDEGAEAAYLIIQDTYDRGEFSKIEDMVYDFSPKAGEQSYWLAKAFIVLGDSFAEEGNFTQAEATFKSIESGYEPKEGGDDVLETVRMRLEKLSQLK